MLMFGGCVIAGAASIAPEAWSGLGPLSNMIGGLEGLALVSNQHQCEARAVSSNGQSDRLIWKSVRWQ